MSVPLQPVHVRSLPPPAPLPQFLSIARRANVPSAPAQSLRSRCSRGTLLRPWMTRCVLIRCARSVLLTDSPQVRLIWP